jgi:hypothetical protein
MMIVVFSLGIVGNTSEHIDQYGAHSKEAQLE